MRQYYDVYSLLDNPLVQEYIGTDAYKKHKEARFVGMDKGAFIAGNPAFNLSGELRERFKVRYEATKALYYNGQPPFDELLDRIHQHIQRL
jgi:hypothetical protein